MIYNVIEYLRASVRRWPDKAAFSDAHDVLTYSQLWAQARAIGTAVYHELGGVRRLPVLVCIGRSVQSVAAFFGVAASGNFYVPIDPNMPEKRLADIGAAMGAKVMILAQGASAPPSIPGVRGIPVETLASAPPEEALLDQVAADTLDIDPLYCMFTSGSTGVPKGVLISHRSVINMAEQFTEAFGFDSGSVFGNQAPFDFDVSIKDVYLSVKNGGTVHILEKQLFSTPKRLIERMNQHRVNTVIWSVSAMKILSALRTFESIRPEYLRRVMFSGEALPCKVLNDWRGHLPEASFVNLYGPTEITCNCTYYKVERPFSNEEALPIGRPFPNTAVFLLDGEEPVTEPGRIGEICVSGSCLALGYYQNPSQTEAAFRQIPQLTAWERKMYRTGDLASWNDEGELVFCGRADSQVKYMGFRIELGEIEIAANSIDFVTSACCLFDQGKEQLCLFYQAQERDDKAVLEALRERLPRSMVPTRLYYFEKLPENRTGKIDRAALRREYIS